MLTLNEIAIAIDAALDNQNLEELEKLAEQCQQQFSKFEGKDRALLKYFEANAYGAINQIQNKNDANYAWSWERPHTVAELLALRQAIIEPDFDELDEYRRCQIYTNLGNCLNTLGRFVEALEAWNKALTICPVFAMAAGNKGHGLAYYARAVYDEGHKDIIFAAARDSFAITLGKALWDVTERQAARPGFKRLHDQLSEMLIEIKYDEDRDLDQWSLGETEPEKHYRRWCLDHQLFLTPLNDVLNSSVAVRDVFHLPNHQYDVSDTVRFPSYFNLMKQEYVSARYWLYKSFEEPGANFVDKGVRLMDGNDGVRYGHHAEELRAAFRGAYSIFDKVALFLNEYFGVGLAPNQVSFRNVWYEKKIPRAALVERRNWPLRGLYYLSKDLFDEELNLVATPDARQIAQLRNRNEHRFLSLQKFVTGETSSDDVHQYILIGDFQDRVLRTLRMARAALIYLSLAMHREEELRKEEKKDKTDGLIVSVFGVPINFDMDDL